MEVEKSYHSQFGFSILQKQNGAPAKGKEVLTFEGQ